MNEQQLSDLINDSYKAAATADAKRQFAKHLAVRIAVPVAMVVAAVAVTRKLEDNSND